MKIRTLSQKNRKRRNIKRGYSKIMTLLLTVGLSFNLVACQSNSSQTSSNQVNGTSENLADNSTNSDAENSSTVAENGGVYTSASQIEQRTGEYSDKALDSSYDESQATKISLNNKTIDVTGEGASVEGTTVTISKKGTYIVEGTLTDGRIIVNLEEDENVQLVLKNANITCKSYSPITVISAKNLYLTLADNTSNTITDGENYEMDIADVEPSAAIFSKDDLIINGGGSLLVNANCNDGITSKDDLSIIEGTITIVAKDDGIVGKDSVTIKDGEINITASGDGIKATNTEDAKSGNIIIDGGKINIASENDGIQAETDLIVNGGDINIVTNGGSQNASAHTNDEIPPNGGGFGNGKMPENMEEMENMKGGERPELPEGEEEGQMPASTENGEMATSTEQSESVSAKALKSTNGIGIFGGNITIDSADDSIHSNGVIRISGGNMTLTSGDDGIHADTDMLIEDGIITIKKSYEGIESQNITLAGGNIDVTASDDGVNISGGNDGSSVNGRPGQNNFSEGTGVLTITGGELTVDASGDGLDSNGSIIMTGGLVTVNGPTNDGNGALDYDGSFTISGGTLLVAGSSGMAQYPTSDGDAAYVSTTLQSQTESTEVTVLDQSGNTVYSFTPTKNFTMIAVAGTDLTKGETYTIKVGTVESSVEAK